MGKPLADRSRRPIHAFPDLGLSPVLLSIGPFDLRWYSLAYLVGIIIGYYYLLKLLKQPGAPLGRRHAEDLAFYAALGIILGGRLGYVLFYNLGHYAANPLDIFKVWDGGMSFHGGVIGTSLGISSTSPGKAEARLAAGSRLCRLLRAFRPAVRPPRQFREPGIVGRAYECRAWAIRFEEYREPFGTDPRPSAPPDPALRGRARRPGAVRDPRGHVLED